MSEVIMLIRARKQLQKVPEDTKGQTTKEDCKRPTSPIGRPAPRSHMSAPPRYVGFPPPPRLHLRHSLSRFDPRACIAAPTYISSSVPPP
jgi:hypothetical protein